MPAYLVFLLDQEGEEGRQILTLPVISASSEAIPKRLHADYPDLNPILIMTREQVADNLRRMDELEAQVRAKSAGSAKGGKSA